MVGHTALWTPQSHFVPLPPLHSGEGSFPGLVPLMYTQIYGFTHTWWAECFAGLIEHIPLVHE